MAIPQGLLDALNAAESAKDDVEASIVAKQGTAAALTTATTADTAAGVDMANKTSVLTTKRAQLEAIEDAYFQPGGAVPTPPPDSQPIPASFSGMKTSRPM